MQINLFPKKEPTEEDLLLFQDANNHAYYHTKISDLNLDVSSPGLTSVWSYSTEDKLIDNESIICDTSFNDITISVVPPTSSISIRIVNVGPNNVFVDLLGEVLQGEILDDVSLRLAANSDTLLVFSSSNSLGWIDLSKTLYKVYTNSFYPGMSLLLEGGSLEDLSGNNNHGVALGESPQTSIGIDGHEVLQWNGTGTQEITIPFFLADTNAATLYCVFTANNEENYNLARTDNLDDYWRFVGSDGYFGTFLSNRVESYPSLMPADGNHLISIHSNQIEYEVFLDNQSQGIRSLAYYSGDRFIIGANDKRFKGQLALMLVYPFDIDPTSVEHQSNLSVIASKYPSLIL